MMEPDVLIPGNPPGCADTVLGVSSSSYPSTCRTKLDHRRTKACQIAPKGTTPGAARVDLPVSKVQKKMQTK